MPGAARKAVGGIGAGIADISQGMLREGMVKDREQRQLLASMFKDYADRVAKGEMEPGQAEEALKLQGAKVPAGYFDKVAPSINSRLSSALTDVTDAKTVSDVPSPTGVATSLQAKRVPLMKFGPIEPGGKNTSALSQPLERGLNLRNEKLDSFPATRVPGVYNPTTGATEEQFVPARSMNTARTFQTAPTPSQKGYNSAEEASTQLTRESELGIPEEKGRQFARTEDVERPAKVATDVARQTGMEPGERRMATFRDDLEQAHGTPTTINNPITGTEVSGRVIRGTFKPNELPPGMEPGKSQVIPATVADNVAGMNAAEIEAVKILRELETTGLKDSNDPLDPRFTKFLINTLRIAPEDPAMRDIQQRVGFINATLTRALMGSRPSQYVAKEIIQPHLPQQNQSGKLLYATIHNVLQQAGTRRTEFARTLGVPIERLAPQGGSFAEYQRMRGVQSEAPATLTVDPQTGQLVPAVRRQ